MAIVLPLGCCAQWGIQEWRVRESLRRVDIEGVLMRYLELEIIHRRRYSMYGPNPLWHKVDVVCTKCEVQRCLHKVNVVCTKCRRSWHKVDVRSNFWRKKEANWQVNFDIKTASYFCSKGGAWLAHREHAQTIVAGPSLTRAGVALRHSQERARTGLRPLHPN